MAGCPSQAVSDDGYLNRRAIRGPNMKHVYLSIAVLSAASVVFAQQAAPQRPAAVAGAGRPQFQTAEVHPDRTITFRFLAPDATAVQLNFSGKHPMTKGEAPYSAESGGIVMRKGVW